MIHAITYFALLIAPDGHVSKVRGLPSPEACVAVVVSYRADVPGGKGSCWKEYK